MQNESPARTIQATALVHEAYLRLVDVTNVDWQHRAQFFAISARIMRNILLDNARARASAKRGGQQARVNLDEIPDVSDRGAEATCWRSTTRSRPWRQSTLAGPRSLSSDSSAA